MTHPIVTALQETANALRQPDTLHDATGNVARLRPHYGILVDVEGEISGG